MAQSITVQAFFKMFSSDDACLEHLMRTRYGQTQVCTRCGKESAFVRLRKLPAYSCPSCGNHIHPMAGTPFADSRTPLQKWFYAMYLFTTTRHGVPAKELQRQLGVTYKTAWRMGHQIRQYMGMVDGNGPLSGTVEADETYVGGKHPGVTGRGAAGKTVVFGMLQKDGDVMTHVVPDAKRCTLEPLIVANVLPGTAMQTDEWHAYKSLPSKGFTHSTVAHGRGEYVRGKTHTNGIEGFWSHFKKAILGTHIHISRQHMAKYLGEFEFRYNSRKEPFLMFDRLLQAF